MLKHTSGFAALLGVICALALAGCGSSSTTKPDFAGYSPPCREMLKDWNATAQYSRNVLQGYQKFSITKLEAYEVQKASDLRKLNLLDAANETTAYDQFLIRAPNYTSEQRGQYEGRYTTELPEIETAINTKCPHAFKLKVTPS